MDWIRTHIPPWFWIALLVHGISLGTVAYLILLERKVASCKWPGHRGKEDTESRESENLSVLSVPLWQIQRALMYG